MISPLRGILAGTMVLLVATCVVGSIYAVGEGIHHGGLNPFEGRANAAFGVTGLSSSGPSQQVVSAATTIQGDER